METYIWFDLDGTIADLYGVENWLPMLRASDPTPYIVAKPLVRLSTLAYRLNRLKKQGYKCGIISWTSKAGTPEYNAEVAAAKLAWLAKHIPSVQFDEVHIVPYGTPKQTYCRNSNDILFDDEAKNRQNWTGVAYDVDDIMNILAGLNK